MDPFGLLSRPARAVLLVVWVAMGGVAVLLFVAASLEADGQAGLVVLALAIYGGFAYLGIAGIDAAVRALRRRAGTR